jgi:hypothetical protein
MLALSRISAKARNAVEYDLLPENYTFKLALQTDSKSAG